MGFSCAIAATCSRMCRSTSRSWDARCANMIYVTIAHIWNQWTDLAMFMLFTVFQFVGFCCRTALKVVSRFCFIYNSYLSPAWTRSPNQQSSKKMYSRCKKWKLLKYQVTHNKSRNNRKNPHCKVCLMSIKY